MVVNVENRQQKKGDMLLWILAIGLLTIGVGAYYYFAAYLLMVRVVALLMAAGVAIWIASRTEVGQIALKYWQEATIEIKKVVWPTRKETMQTTLVVIAMIFVMGLFLWFIDAVLLRLVAKILY